MGPCNSVNHSKPPQTVPTSQTPRTESQTFNPEDIPIPIINRLSKRTKFDDISKYITISENSFLGKGATGIVREGQNKEGTKYAIKTVRKSDVEKN